MKILIIKTSALGDILQAFPALDYLYEKFQLPVDWVVEASCSELVSSHPFIGHTHQIHWKQWKKKLSSMGTIQEMRRFFQKLKTFRYDVAFDLQGNIKSACILSQVRAKEKVGFGRKTVAEWPNLLATRKRFDPPPGQNRRLDYLAVVQSYFQDSVSYKEKEVFFHISQEDKMLVDNLFFEAPEKTVLVCPGAAWPNKRLPVHALKQLLSQWKEAFYLFVWKSFQEKEIVEALYLSFSRRSRILPQLSLLQLQEVMRRSSLVIAMDSLALHLCATTATASLSFFGPSSENKYRPVEARHVSIQGMCPYGIHFESRCPHLRSCPTGACLKNLEIEKIAEKILF